MNHNPKYTKLINSWKWQKLRREHLCRHPLCARCERQGRVVAATEVHHITPILTCSDELGMERLAYDSGNLMSLCHACHKAIHDGMGHKRRTKGQQKALTKAIASNFERWLPPIKKENNGTIQQD